MNRQTKNKIMAIVTSVIAIFLPALILGKWMEGIFFYICHWLIRPQFKKQYHHIMPAMCRLITSAVFFFGVSFVLPLPYSLLSAIPINYFIGWVGFTKKQADDFEVKYERLKAKLEQKKDFNTDTCSEQELIDRCKDLRLSKEATELCIEMFIYKTKQSELASKLFIEEKSIQQRKRRLKQKLNKK